MKAPRIIGFVLLAYLLIVFAFESAIGYFQPADETTMVLHTTGPDGATSDRVVTPLEAGGQVYIASNHWVRGWYHDVLAQPSLEVTYGGTTTPYLAVPVTDQAEFERIDSEFARGLVLKFLTGFPPRHLVRLDSAQ